VSCIDITLLLPVHVHVGCIKARCAAAIVGTAAQWFAVIVLAQVGLLSGFLLVTLSFLYL
jgi:uncharacterized membrane-anchored protein YjiN (DUF445 family)